MSQLWFPRERLLERGGVQLDGQPRIRLRHAAGYPHTHRNGRKRARAAFIPLALALFASGVSFSDFGDIGSMGFSSFGSIGMANARNMGMGAYMGAAAMAGLEAAEPLVSWLLLALS